MAIIFWLILALWVIPTYVGTKRKIGYTKSMLICLIASPLIGLVVILLSPRIEEQ